MTTIIAEKKACKDCGEVSLNKNSNRTLCDNCIQKIMHRSFIQLEMEERPFNDIGLQKLLTQKKYGFPVRFCTDPWILED